MQSDWATIEIDGVQHIIHRRPSPAAVEATGTLSAIAAKKKRTTPSCRQSATRTVRLGGHVQSGTRRAAQKIRGNHSLRKQNPHQRAYWVGVGIR